MSKSVSIRPLHDRVIIERIEERTTAGGIVIPETAGDKPQRGRVRAVGAGKAVDGKLQSLEVKVGDQVLFGKYSGTEVKVDGQELLVMREEDIMGIVEA
ncbi:MAG: co-chaperone GroES [Francisellaceae bacterium]|jgi:chaperonin GroES|nr:co-chaperone GroES [Francisellaceae bacterium]MBT6538153.1 co-chaperone GroES [Francisellaceae bacterium]